MSSTGKSLALALTLIAGAAQLGCRACGTCHDYDPPVANCNCNCCGDTGGRSGSVLAQTYAADEQTTEGAAHIARQQGESFGESDSQTR